MKNYHGFKYTFCNYFMYLYSSFVMPVLVCTRVNGKKKPKVYYALQILENNSTITGSTHIWYELTGWGLNFLHVDASSFWCLLILRATISSELARSINFTSAISASWSCSDLGCVLARLAVCFSDTCLGSDSRCRLVESEQSGVSSVLGLLISPAIRSVIIGYFHILNDSRRTEISN